MPGIVPWLVPVIAAVGAAVVTRVFVGTLVRAVRAHRTGRPPRLLHLELRNGMSGVREDPLTKTVGCFDATRTHPADRLLLTYPGAC
jgi:hypothetical protein